MADSNVPAMTATMLVLGAVSLLFMCLRFYSKRISGKKATLDDIVLGFSWVLYLVFVIMSIYTTQYGLGKHLDDIDLTLLPRCLYLMPIGQFFAVISVAVSKSSFILTLMRLVPHPWQKAALWFMLATINTFMLSIAIVQFYQCGPVPTKGCVNGNSVIGLGVFAAGYSAAMDLVLTAFPSLVIWNLQMKRREKVGIITSMSLGVVAGVVGIYKSSTIPKVARDSDFTYGTAIVLIWLVAEVTATIIAASIPFYRPLVRQISSTKGQQESLGMTPHSRGLNKLGSHTDNRSGVNFDDNSDREIFSTNSKIVRKTNVTVEYDSYPTDEERRHNGQRDVF